MFSRILTASIFGLDVEASWVEVNIARGLPRFLVVGLADQAVKEAADRIHAAVVNCELEFPDRRVTVNLTPAGRSKTGSHYDLPIAVGLLVACGQLKDARKLAAGTAFIGELSLDGKINSVEGVLPMVIGLQKLGIKRVVLPLANLGEASLVEDMELFGASCLSELKDFMEGKIELAGAAREADAPRACDEYPDFADIRGQLAVKRAAQIAAAGMHGMLMIGPPGVGKSMVGKRIPGIMPPMSYSEKMDITQIYSIAGELGAGRPIISERPFRSPHHSMSAASLIGGGKIPHPGEISLAHNGVLFLDELPEFAAHTIDMLRQPMEDRCVAITRANGRCVFPSDFMLVAAMNPCRCGYFGDPVKPCSCSSTDRQRYVGKISGPLLDRIDIHVAMERTVYSEMVADGSDGLSTAVLREGVIKAADIQKERYRGLDICRNSQLGPSQIKKYCKCTSEASATLELAFNSLNLSARAYHRVLKVARTIADMDGEEIIGEQQVLEALSYRKPDKYFSSL